MCIRDSPQDLVTFLLGTPLPQRQHMAERLGILPRAKRVFQRVVAGLHLIHHRLLCIGGQGQQNRKHTVLRTGEKGVLPLHPPVNLLRPGGHPIQVPSPRPICQQQGGQREVLGGVKPRPQNLVALKCKRHPLLRRRAQGPVSYTHLVCTQRLNTSMS